MALLPIADHAPASLPAAVTTTRLASGATVMSLSSPCGYFGFRLSGYALHPEHFPAHRQGRARRQLEAATGRLESRVQALRSILSRYCDHDGLIVDGRSLRGAFRLEPVADGPGGDQRWHSVLSDPSGEHRYVLETHAVSPEHPDLVRFSHDRVVREFLAWIPYDAKRRSRRRRAAQRT